ncbi:S1/P1 nuclease [Chytriomyces sp. MP71]|nr:S1/P1 nuclease [Chytriomyces sp. MP71]
MQANPPAACGFIPSDCAQGNCIIGAMTRFTNVLLNSKCAPSTATTQAVEFLVHFLGDITQPLHNCKRDVGGNSDTVTFNGASTNFHHIHDTDIPAAYAVEKGYGATDIQGVAGYLDSKYSTNIAAYTSPVYIDIHTTDSYGNLVATIAMANDGNALDCSKSAFWTLYDQDPNQDFGGAYYDAVSLNVLYDGLFITGTPFAVLRRRIS